MLLSSLFLLTVCLFVVLSPTHLLVEANDNNNNNPHNKDIEPGQGEEQDFERLGLHYGKYLKEVVAELDKDQKFTDIIKNMSSEDIKSGKVAEQLKHVHEDIRKKLNDLKYLEVKRLRDLATRKNEIEQYGESYHGKDNRKWRTVNGLQEVPGHLGSHHSFFDVDDLHKLMLSATNDLEKLDQKRKEEFKVYEMEKEHQFQERIKTMNETEKADAIKLRDELQKKHDDHPKINEPGKKDQFKEVWEKQDHLPGNEFNPRTFFSMHDTNNDNHWDWDEVKQILVNEINKLYDTNNPEDDPNEMDEEFERMREHVYQIIDSDKDGLISLKEFVEYSKKPEFSNNNAWQSPKNTYSKEDYEYYTKHREEKLKENHGFYDSSLYANQPANLHLPNWGYAGVPPYYGMPVDPNHPQASQILAAQQHQQLAYQQAVYQQQAQAPYIQAPAHPQQAYQQQPPQQPNQQYYQAQPVPQIAQNQPQQQYQQRPPVPQQVNYQQPAAPVPQLNQQPQMNNYQHPPAQQAPQAVPQQTFQQPPQPSLQPAIQQPLPQQQQQIQQPQQQPPVQQPSIQQNNQSPPPSNQQYYQQPPQQQPNHQ